MTTERETTTSTDVNCDGFWNWAARRETPLQRADRNFVELLQEVRVLQTGVQILFGLLLTVAFYPRFAQTDSVERTVYVVSLVSTVVTAALLIAPVAFHRRVFQRGLKRHLVNFANLQVRLGTFALAVAMLSALFLVLDVVLPRGVAVGILAPLVLVFGVLWFMLPRLGLRLPPDAVPNGDNGSQRWHGDGPGALRRPRR